MAMRVRYTVLDGEVVSEKRSGVERDYVPDLLGSTVALLDNTQTQTDTFSYWPYGEERARTGTTATPFRFVGTLGYFRDSAGTSYVRTRTLDRLRGRWLTRDPIGGEPVESAYAYVNESPISERDPSGLEATRPNPGRF